MFEAKLKSADTFKKLIDTLSALVPESNIDCSDAGMSLQCMDSGHIALVFLELKKEGFADYRIDRDVPLGVSFTSWNKILKCAGSSDSLTMTAAEGEDVAKFTFENEKSNRISQFEMKLLSIDTELLSIPDNEYDVTITMPSAELGRICRDLGSIGENVTISAIKGEVRFSTTGDVGNANITIKPSTSIDDEDNVRFMMNSLIIAILSLDESQYSLNDNSKFIPTNQLSHPLSP